MKRGFGVLVGIVLVAMVGGGAGLATGQQKIPPDFTYEQGKESPGTVTFSHAKHKEDIEKCTGCHTKIFKMKRGQTGIPIMAKMEAGEQCGACHNGKTKVKDKAVFATNDKQACEKCHKK